MPATLARVLAIAVALAAGSALFAETRHYGLIGFDTYPLIVTSRVEAPGDLSGLLVERLMDGRYPSAFYRPLVSASFALDEALWGLDPFGYQLTGALLFSGLLLALAALGWRLGGCRARWLAVLVPLVFLASPTYYEVVPVPARRADLMCGLFAVLAVVLVLGERAAGAGVASLLAVLSKESGYVTPPLVLAAAWLFAEASSPAGRLRRAAGLAWPAFGLAAAALAARWWLLGGLGGHGGPFHLMGVLEQAPGIALELLRGSLLPGASSVPALWTLLLVSGALAAGGFALTREFRKDPVQLRLRRALGLGACWFLAFVAIYAVVGWVGAWYYLLPSIGVAVGFAALLGWLVCGGLAGTERLSCRVSCVAAALGLSGVALWQASSAPFFHDAGEWARASRAAAEFLAELDGRVGASLPGQAIDAPPLPMWVRPRAGGAGVEGAAILSDYSVQAWADLVHPERRVRVLGIAGGLLAPEPERAAPDELVVRLVRRRAGY